MRIALLLAAASLITGCAPRADQVFTAPGRLTTGSSGAQPGYAIKLVQAKRAPTEVVADDGSLCRLTAERFAQVEPGRWIACNWTIALDTIAASTSEHDGGDLDPELVASFANVTDSISFSDSRYGWSDCCWQTILTLRPHGTWTFVRVDTTVRWFEAAADSGAFRAVTRRLLQLGFVAGWPTSFGARFSDVPVATLILRAPGQCHQTSASPEYSQRPLPSEWLTARAMLDSLAAHVRWQVRAPPHWAVVDRHKVAVRSMCGSDVWFQ